MTKKLIIVFSVIVAALSNVVTFAMTQEEADIYNNLYYPQSVYNGGINHSPQQSTQEAYVNPATGSVNISVTDLALPGVNGFDLNITRMYNSTNASMFEAYLKETDVPYEATYYMITGNKRVYKSYINGNWNSTPYEDVCLTPKFFDYIDSETDKWMILNSSEYEYEYIDNPPATKLFGTYSDAVTAIEYLNTTSWEISSTDSYSDVKNYEIDYYNFTIKTVKITEYYTDYSDGLIDDTATERYSKLGIGWEFTFPYVETRYGYDDDYEYLHFGEKGTWLIDLSDGGNNNLSGYPLNDIILSEDSSIIHDGEQSKYVLTEKNGTKYYFGTDGRLLIKQDRFGNQIKFYCNTESYENVWGEWKDYPYITRIVDTLGREVAFTFETSGSDYYMYMTVTDPTDLENPRIYTYFLDKLSDSQIGITEYDECDNLECDEWVLKKVTDPVGKYYSYDYDFLQTKFNFLDRNEQFCEDYLDEINLDKGNSYIDNDNFEDFNGIHNSYALLKSSTTRSEKSYYFKYSPFIKNCTQSGSMMFYKAYRSYEESAESYSGESYYLNDKSYSYDIYSVGEYDGYYGYHKDDNISNSYNYAVKVTDKNADTGKLSYDVYKYTYLGSARDKTILLTRLTDYGTDHYIVTDYAYDNDLKILTSQITKNYSLSDLSVYLTNSISYTYDSGNYGDILTETPNGENDRMITYTYNSTYHYPTSKTYKQNTSTTIREEYIPTANNKSIEYINIYENNVLKSKTRYNHDSYGNIVNEKKYINSEDYIEKQFTYQNGALITSETTKEVKDNDNISNDIFVSTTYDYWGNPLTMTDANGNVTSYSYDKINRIIRTVNPDESNTTLSYTSSSYKSISETDELGNSITTYYNKDGEIECVRYDDLGLDYNFRYFTPLGQLETEVIYTDNPEGNQAEHSRTVYAYDTYQRPIVKEVYDSSNTLIYKETYSYEITADYVKEATTVIGSENNPSVITSVYYDKYGNKIKTQIGNDVETYTTDYAGNILTVKSAKANNENSNNVRTAEYNFMGKVTRETDELGNVTRAEYDQLGRLIKSYDAKGYATEFTYDNLGRVIEQKTPFEERDGTVYYSVKKVWYDNNGNVIKERVLTNASGDAENYNEVMYTYDNRNRLIMTQANDGEKSNYTQNYYDATGNLLRVYTGLHAPLTINGLDDVTTGSDSEYAVTKYSYDSLGRLITTTDALGQIETNTYDVANGLLETTTDRNGQTFNFTYNGLGAITSKALSNGTNAETTTYGLTGQVLSKQNGTTTINYVYNDKGQLVSESNSAAGTNKVFTYDSNGNRTGFILTRNGATEISQSYTYDLLNRLTSVSENGAVIASYSYDVNSNRTQTTVTGGETTNYSYNIANMLTSQTTGDKLSEQYTYYLNGNQKSKTSNGTTTNYEYDKMNRLISENDTDYSFDDFGNRVSMTDGTVTTSYTYDLNNRLSESNAVNGNITTNTKFFYDNNGNQISKAVMVNQPYSEGMSGDYTISNISDSFVALYEYNCYNQLVGVDTNGVVSTYAYAPDGLRHSKTVGGNTITFVYDNANVVEEITADGTNKYYRGIEIVKNNNGLYYLYNGQDDVALLVDADGTIVADYAFDAYGNQSEENTIYNPFGYRGEYTDAESGLVYLRARMYDPQTGRFINEDPIRYSTNWYIYASNNPILFIDYLGLVPSTMDAALMSDHVYHHDWDEDIKNRRVYDIDGNYTGWRMIDMFTHGSSKIGVYVRGDGKDNQSKYDGPMEYVLAFKGTKPTNAEDWENNAQQYIGEYSEHLTEGVAYTGWFVKKYGDYEITFTGHSKGGGEAAVNAELWNKKAIVFNPSVPKITWWLGDQGYVEPYVVNGEILNHILGEIPLGTTRYLKNGSGWFDRTEIWDRINYHGMKTVIDALNRR